MGQGGTRRPPPRVLPILSPQVSLTETAESLTLGFAEAAAKAAGLTLPQLRRLIRFAHVVRALLWWTDVSDGDPIRLCGEALTAAEAEVICAIGLFADRHELDVELSLEGIARFIDSHAPGNAAIAF